MLLWNGHDAQTEQCFKKCFSAESTNMWLKVELTLHMKLENLHTLTCKQQINAHTTPLEWISCNKIHYHTKMSEDSFMSPVHCSGHWPGDLGFLTSDLWFWPLIPRSGSTCQGTCFEKWKIRECVSGDSFRPADNRRTVPRLNGARVGLVNQSP